MNQTISLQPCFLIQAALHTGTSGLMQLLEQMETTDLFAWRELLKAESLGEQANACLRIARRLAGEEYVTTSWLILNDRLAQPAEWMFQTDPAGRIRHYLECPLTEEFLVNLTQTPGVRVFAGLPTQFLRSRLRQTQTEPAYLPAHTVVVPLGPNPCHDGLWLIGLRGSPTLTPEQMSALEQGGFMLALVQGRVRRTDRVERINHQLRQLHEMLHLALIATDEPALFDTCLRVATRHFGFDRVLLALMSPDTGMLHTAVHTGFGATGPEPLLNPAEQDFYMPLMKQGDMVIADEGNPLLARFPRYDNVTPSRIALFPLQAAGRTLGLIYADQVDPAGTPLYLEVLDLFQRQTGVALENLRLRLQAEQRAETDPLTGLHNRAYLDRLLEIEIPRVRRYNHPISLLMIDLCDFKRVNDTYGHPFGDFLLRETAKLLKANVRRPDVVVRYGGDEFVVVMVNTGPAQAEHVKQRIEQSFIDRNRLQDDDRTKIHISIGLRSATAETLGDLVNDADQAMYAQKARQKRQLLIQALISGSTERIEAADRVVGNLCMMLYKKATYYPGHAARVAALSALLGRRLNLSSDDLEALVLAALLHGVGKVSLPAEILMKPGPLNDSEKLALRNHVQIGEEFFEGLEHLDPLRPILRTHHERYDGDMGHPEFPGYPNGLAGERIPLASRILKLAEAADAMLTPRPWREPKPVDAAVAHLRAESGKAFDPRLVRAMLADEEWHRAIESPETTLARMLED